MDDLTRSLNSTNIGCSMNGTSINNLLYADDTCILAPCPAALQKLLDICVSFALDNNIVYNDTKTKLMCIKPKSLKDITVPDIYLNDKLLTIVDSEKYLGMFITSKLEDNQDICRHVRAMYSSGNLLMKRFKSCSTDVKILSNLCPRAVIAIKNTNPPTMMATETPAKRGVCLMRTNAAISAAVSSM